MLFRSRLPLNKVGLNSRINRAYCALEQEFEREPTVDELAEMLGLEREEIESTLGVAARHVSVDAPISNTEDGSLLDVMEDPNAERVDAALEHHASLHTDLCRTLGTLPERQRDVLMMYYGIGVETPLSIEDIGHRFELTRERVRQIKDRALLTLQTGHKCVQLKTYLGV